MRCQEINIEKSWRFIRDERIGYESPDFDDSDWETVDVPHDWAIKGPFDPENDKEIDIINTITDEVEHFVWPGRTAGLPHVGKGFYRKEFMVPDFTKSDRARLEIDGIMSNSKIHCNGVFVGGRPYGYSSFALDLSECLRPGKNVIAVSAENLPASSRWYPGAGIYRHIRLIITGPVQIDHWGTRVVSTRNRIQVRTSTSATDLDENVELSTEFYDGDGNLVCSDLREARVAGGHEFNLDVEISNPQYWSPVCPCLYKTVSSVKIQGEVVDRTETLFGLRDIAFHPNDGFSINGRRTPLKGVCLHHDLGPLGAAVNTAAMRRQLRILKEMGCNAIRTAHNPPAPKLLDLCDEMGFLAIDEAFDEWEEMKSPNGYNILFKEWAERDLRDMIRRDANHPSVIMWSIGNEISEQYRPHGTDMARFLRDICHDEDPTRPVTAGLNDNDDTVTGGLFEAVDVHGFNYKPYMYGIYHHRHPDRAVYSSESASTVSTRGEYAFPVFEGVRKQENLQLGSFDLAHTPGGTIPDHEFKGQDENPFVMGEFVWTGFDYLGEPSPYREEWPARSSYYGICDLAGLPKDRYYLYQSRWTDQEVLHIMPHWTWPGREGEPLFVQCYTRCQQAELFVNGVSKGIQRKNPKSLLRRYRLIWENVIYEPGELKVIGLDSDGEIVIEKTIRTAGEPARVNLTSDKEFMAMDGEDMVFVTAEITDDNDNPCPSANNQIAFSVSGSASIAAVCNGDPTSLEDFTGDAIKAFHGKCVACVRSRDDLNPTDLEVTAKAIFDGNDYQTSARIRHAT